MLILLLNYAFRLVALLVVLAARTAPPGCTAAALGLTVVACALTWVVAQAFVSLRHHDPLDV